MVAPFGSSAGATIADRRPWSGRHLTTRLARWLRRGSRSSVALEFGIIAIPFIATMLAVFELSYDLYVQAELDNALEIAARGVQVGSTSGQLNESSGTLVAKSICPNLGGMLDCSLLTVAVGPLPTGQNYFSDPVDLSAAAQAAANAGNGVCTGTPGQMMRIRAWYDGPTFVGLLIPSFTASYNGSLVHVTTATAGFVNEFFTGGGQSGGTACSAGG